MRSVKSHSYNGQLHDKDWEWNSMSVGVFQSEEDFRVRELV
jgi:hypothetical protein